MTMPEFTKVCESLQDRILYNDYNVLENSRYFLPDQMNFYQTCQAVRQSFVKTAMLRSFFLFLHKDIDETVLMRDHNQHNYRGPSL